MMPTLGLTNHSKVPPMIPQRVVPEVPMSLITSVVIKYVGRLGLNMYRTIDGKHTIKQIAWLFGKPEVEVLRIMKVFQKARYITLAFPTEASRRETIACVPTMIISHADLGLATQ